MDLHLDEDSSILLHEPILPRRGWDQQSESQIRFACEPFVLENEISEISFWLVFLTCKHRSQLSSNK